MAQVLKGLNKPLIDAKGPVGMISKSVVFGLGGGAAADIFDKQATKGALTRAGIPLGKTLNGKPLTLNATDAAALVLVNGIKIPTVKTVIPMVIVLGIKKWAESKDLIDPYEALPAGHPDATNVTNARNREKQPAIPEYQFGGNY